MALQIAVLVPAGTDEYNDKILAAIKPVIPSDVEVKVFNLSSQDAHNCIEGRFDLTHNSYAVIKKAQELETKGYNGIWLSDFDMCGVEAAREVLDIPIIGGFPPSAFTALALSQRFSIITILPSTMPMQREHIHTYGLESSFVSIRDINEHVQNLPVVNQQLKGVLRLYHILQLHEADVSEMVFQEAKAAVQEDGAQSILLGCTGFVDVARFVSERLTKELGEYIPVVDPNQAGFSFLLSLVRMGLKPSRFCYIKKETLQHKPIIRH